MYGDQKRLEAPSHPADEGAEGHQQSEQPSAAKPAPRADRSGQAEPRHRSSLRVIAGVVGVLALGAGAYFGHSWWTTGRFMVATDDAYVGARSSTLSPKVSGYIAAVNGG